MEGQDELEHGGQDLVHGGYAAAALLEESVCSGFVRGGEQFGWRVEEVGKAAVREGSCE